MARARACTRARCATPSTWSTRTAIRRASTRRARRRERPSWMHFGIAQQRALRAAIGATVAFYLGWIVLDDPVLAVFATLSVIGLLVLADFGGDRRTEASAYALATVI